MNKLDIFTPVLLLVYNRPDYTSEVLKTLKKNQIKEIFIAANAPNPNKSNDFEKCGKVKAIIEKIDWECNVKYLFRDNHLKINDSIISAIDWFFSHVEKGIILEDDCIPRESFFYFCQYLLDYYGNDNRIMMISGTNHLGKWNQGTYSYYFSKIGGNWGWATWKRAWQIFNKAMPEWEDIKKSKVLFNIFKNEDEALYWESNFANNPAWDYIWMYYKLINNGLTVMPPYNLVENIGFGIDATHTKNKDYFPDHLFETADFDVAKLMHPIGIFPDNKFDTLVYKKVIMHKPQRNIKSRLFNSLKRRLKYK